MRFVDEVKIHIRAGDGGKGCISFRREKYVPRGGPDGGDGGKGGDVVLKAAGAKQTLLDFHFQRHFQATRGAHGRGKQQTGKNGDDCTLLLPVGTQVRDVDSGELLGDLTQADDCLVVAKGGEGGKGNMHFATSSRRAPRGGERTVLCRHSRSGRRHASRPRDREPRQQGRKRAAGQRGWDFPNRQALHGGSRTEIRRYRGPERRYDAGRRDREL